MAFKRVPQKFTASVNEVTIGTGDKAVVLGGANVLPLYSFDAPITNRAKIGVEITDSGYDRMEFSLRRPTAKARSHSRTARRLKF